jgi:sulfopyruvate decarboxylase TPP-binding subunit
MTTTTVQSVPARLLHDEVSKLGISHVLSVPDTHQRTLLASLTADTSWRTLTLSTEDEALCVNAGLWIGGAEPLVIIQNVGLFASMNALRGMSMDMKIPTFMLVGQYGRNIKLPVEEDPSSGCRLIQGMLASIDVPCYVIDGPEDVGVITKGFKQSRDERGPVVVLISAPTA